MITITIGIMGTIMIGMISTITIGTTCTMGTNESFPPKSEKLSLSIGDEKTEGKVFMNLKGLIGWRQKEAFLEIDL